jgi:hypothetical protein
MYVKPQTNKETVMARGTWGGTLDPNIFRATIRFTRAGQHCQTSFKLRDAVTNDNTAQEVADAVNTALTASFRGILLTTDLIEGIDVLRLGSEEGGWHPLGAGVAEGQLDVSSAGQGTPAFVSANLALKSEVRKRYGQGRMFLPLVHDGWIDGNLMNATGISNYNAFLTAMTSNFTGDPVTHDLILVNAHPLLPAHLAPGQPGYRAEIPASWYDVVSLRLNTTVTMLRSRKLGVGN